MARVLCRLLNNQELSRAAVYRAHRSPMGNGGSGLCAHRGMPHPGRRSRRLEAPSRTWDFPDPPGDQVARPFPSPPSGPVSYRPVAYIPPANRRQPTWAKETSALGELLGADFQHFSNNTLPPGGSPGGPAPRDRTHLAHKAQALFALGEKIILYDLTNTYLTGRAQASSLGPAWPFQGKRIDRPLLTLALVLDGDSFPKASRVFSGNVQRTRYPDGDAAYPATRGDTTGFSVSGSSYGGYGCRDRHGGRSGGCPGSRFALHRRASRSRPRRFPKELVVIRERVDSTTIQVKRLDQAGEVLLSARAQPGAARKQPCAPVCSNALKKACKSGGWPDQAQGLLKTMPKFLGRLGRLREPVPDYAPNFMTSRYSTVMAKCIRLPG